MTDPIRQTGLNAIQLFEQFGRQADGYQADQVIDAAANLIVNALRQSHSTRLKAEQSWDELMAKAKSRLMECYDVTGHRLKGAYPFHQVITVPFMGTTRREQ